MPNAMKMTAFITNTILKAFSLLRNAVSYSEQFCRFSILLRMALFSTAFFGRVKIATLRDGRLTRGEDLMPVFEKYLK